MSVGKVDENTRNKYVRRPGKSAFLIDYRQSFVKYKYRDSACRNRGSLNVTIRLSNCSLFD